MTSPVRPVLTVSEDGYIRLTKQEFAALALVHLITCLDEQDFLPAASAAITGFTEWVSVGSPAITLGWDWQLLPGQQLAQRINEPRTNLMLIDNISGADFSQYKITTFLCGYIDSMAWQEQAMGALQGSGPHT